MLTIFAIELFQARRDAAIPSSKILLDHSSHALRNDPINSQLLFDNKIKEVAKSNLEIQQHRFLASSANNLTIQTQKSTYTATGLFRKPKQPTKFLDLNRINHIGLRINHSPLCLIQKGLV